MGTTDAGISNTILNTEKEYKGNLPAVQQNLVTIYQSILKEQPVFLRN